MPQKAQNWPKFPLKIYRNLLSSIYRKIGKMNLSIIIDKLSVIGNSIRGFDPVFVLTLAVLVLTMASCQVVIQQINNSFRAFNALQSGKLFYIRASYVTSCSKNPLIAIKAIF